MMRRPRHFHPLEVNFLKSEIESGVPQRAKRALQSICSSYRAGVTINPSQIAGIENAIIGALHSGTSDEKVRRWALNAIAVLGRSQSCLNSVMSALVNYADEPQVAAAAVAALFKLERQSAQSIIRNKNVLSEELTVLAALQTVKASALDLSGVKIDINKSDPTTLKLALILVGLNRAPERILHPRFDNKVIVKELGGHDEPLVSQYSVWAIAENDLLSHRDLGVDVSDMGQHPENVRSYIYRLFAQDKEYSPQHHDILMQGIEDDALEARTGLAIGLSDSYFPELDLAVRDWYFSESNTDVQDYLLDHIVRQSDRSETYADTTTTIFKDERGNLRRRERMLAMASRTELYGQLQAIAYKEELGFLGHELGAGSVTNTFNNFGSVQGATSVGGTALNTGAMENVLTVDQINQAQNLLSQARSEITAAHLDDGLKQEALKVITDAQSNPTKDRIAAVNNVLSKTSEGLKSIADSGESVSKIAGFISALSAFLS